MKYMEKESLDRVAQRYRDEGYEVVVEPPRQGLRTRISRLGALGKLGLPLLHI